MVCGQREGDRDVLTGVLWRLFPVLLLAICSLGMRAETAYADSPVECRSGK